MRNLALIVTAGLLPALILVTSTPAAPKEAGTKAPKKYDGAAKPEDDKGTAKPAKVTKAGTSSKAGAGAAANGPTFAKDVAPILFDNCVSCHRQGEVAPFT